MAAVDFGFSVFLSSSSSIIDGVHPTRTRRCFNKSFTGIPILYCVSVVQLNPQAGIAIAALVAAAKALSENINDKHTHMRHEGDACDANRRTRQESLL